MENAKAKAIAIRDSLGKEVEKTKEGNLQKKETKKRKIEDEKKQMSLFVAFNKMKDRADC